MVTRGQQRSSQLRASVLLAQEAELKATARARKAAVKARPNASGNSRPIRVGSVSMSIPWDQTSHWYPRDGRAMLLEEMGQQHLYNTVNWAVKNCARLYCHYLRLDSCEDPAAKVWLRDQPLFRALIQEAIRRGFTFSPEVYGYLQAYVVDDVIFEPWADEAQAFQKKKLKKFLKAPVVKPDREFDGRVLRRMKF